MVIEACALVIITTISIKFLDLKADLIVFRFASDNQGLKFNAQIAPSEFSAFSITGNFLGRINFASVDAKNTAFVNEMKIAGYTNGV